MGCWLETQPRAGTDDGSHPDIRGSAKPLPQSSESSSPSRLRLFVASWISHSVLEDSRRELPTSTATRASWESSCAGLHALADCPDKSGEFASNCSHRLRSANSAIEVAIAAMKPGLGFEGEVDEVWRNALQSAFELALEARGEARVVSGLHQDVPKVAVAGAGDSALMP